MGLPQCGAPDSDGASKFTESYAGRHKRAGERVAFWGCSQKDEDDADQGFACDVVYRPLRGLRLDLATQDDGFKVIRVRSGVRRGLELPGLTD
jgi:hypothetical protein